MERKEKEEKLIIEIWENMQPWEDVESIPDIPIVNKDIYDKYSGIARHDLIAALITDEFNWTNMFGTQIHLISDKPMVVDMNYAGRTLIFEQTTTNSIVKNGRVINSTPVRQ